MGVECGVLLGAVWWHSEEFCYRFGGKGWITFIKTRIIWECQD